MTTHLHQFGREDSFKICRGRLLTERILFGANSHAVGSQTMLQLCTSLGMPALYQPLLRQHFKDANMVLFGLDTQKDQAIFKVYLEFWDQLRREVLVTHSKAPRRLGLGVKWHRQTGIHGTTDYLCYPLLAVPEIVQRINALYHSTPEPHPPRAIVTELIQLAKRRVPTAEFLYVELAEEGTPRRSFDVNMYKADLTIAHILNQLNRLGNHYEIDDSVMTSFYEQIAQQPLGHLSGGFDRHGNEFSTVYYEISG